MSQSERRLAAIMYTDMVGYAALGQKDESLSLAMVEAQQKVLGPVLARHGGRVVKTMGDALLVKFSSALQQKLGFSASPLFRAGRFLQANTSFHRFFNADCPADWQTNLEE